MRLLSYLGQWRSVAKEAMDLSVTVAKFMGLLHVTDAYLCSSTLVYGPSMLPTLNISGDVLLSEHVSHRIGKVGPGDLVLVRSPTDPRKIVTKRVLGMQGDKVTYFVDPKHSDRLHTTVVPRGHVWIQGDNIYSSFDSRTYGPIPYGLIQGKVFCRVWPPDSFGSLD
ncbi:mitochondrial inner membrane protease subunit 1 [Pyrus x bretschneideri]|uniref:mitochondrial inner membrane protease subunit 1 n=1 Tax=Pyrus x bretschneideri TaxID=225117 RepID=UPI00202F060A|nr:mitochondrial inner membrane protease subunit 1 [Pyrus x bretschneideri]